MLRQRFIVIQHFQTWHVETSDPHIHHDGNLEVGLVILEAAFQRLPVGIRAKGVPFLLAVLVFVARTYHIQQLHSVHVVQFFCRKLAFVHGFPLLAPFRT